MKKIDFCEVLSDIDENYIKEAHAPRVKKRPGWVRWGAAAACLAALAVAVGSVLPTWFNRPGALLPGHPDDVILDDPNNDAPPADSKLHISMEDIVFNEISEFADAGRRWYDPDLYDEVTWDKDEIMGYYGKDLTPAYISEGLTPAPGNETAVVITDKRGKIAEDTVWLGFYHAYYKDGSPKLTEEIAAVKGFSVIVSKIGLLNDCIYLLPENEAKTSDIDGTAVIFGYRSMPYGPYTPDTHEPSGHYDMYIAEFERDGIEYQLVAEQLEKEEFVKIVSSVIYGEEATVDK